MNQENAVATMSLYFLHNNENIIKFKKTVISSNTEHQIIQSILGSHSFKDTERITQYAILKISPTLSCNKLCEILCYIN